MVAVPAALLALRLQPTLELRHDAVHGREVLERAARQRAVELVERPLGRQRLRALDLLALQLAAQQLLEPAQLVARQPVAAGIVLVEVRLRLGAQPERTADALHVDADDPRALALPAERRDASRARSRSAASEPSRSAAAICWRSVSRFISSKSAPLPVEPSDSLTPASTAAASAARKKKRSKTSSKMRRSSGDFASVADSAARKSSGSVHATASSTAKPSSSSEVPAATPSERSSSQNSTSRDARCLGGRGGHQAPG